MKTAVIDIGSNSVRYAIISDPYKVNPKQLISTVLAENLSNTGLLNLQRITLTADAVAKFVAQAKMEKAEEIYIFATEAVRSASNRDDFISAVKHRCGRSPAVISGETEALIGFIGCADKHKSCAVIDIGGASVEVICGQKNKINYSKSLPLGMVRLIDTVKGSRQQITDYIAKSILAYDKIPDTNLVLGIGGTATSLAAMAINPLTYNANIIDGYCLTLETLNKLTDNIFKLKSVENIISAYPVLSLNRARVISYGAIMLSELVKYLNKKEIFVSERDNMEGYILYKNNV